MSAPCWIQIVPWQYSPSPAPPPLSSLFKKVNPLTSTLGTKYYAYFPYHSRCNHEWNHSDSEWSLLPVTSSNYHQTNIWLLVGEKNALSSTEASPRVPKPAPCHVVDWNNWRLRPGKLQGQTTWCRSKHLRNDINDEKIRDWWPSKQRKVPWLRHVSGEPALSSW